MMLLTTFHATSVLADHVFDPKGTSVIASGGGTASGWVVIEFTTDGATAYLDLLAAEIDQPGHAGAYGFRADGSYAGGAQVIAMNSYDHLFVDVTAPEQQGVHHEATTVAVTGGWGAAVRIRVNDPGDGTPTERTLRYVLMATNARTWSWELMGGPGVELVQAIEGDTAVALSGKDLVGPANAGAYVTGVGGQATVLSEHHVTPEHTLVGTFFAVQLTGRYVMEKEAGGATMSCPCGFGSTAGAGGPGEGSEHVFRATGAGGGTSNFGGLFLAHADVPIPWGQG